MPACNEANELDKALTCQEAAAFLATTPKTLCFWRNRRRGPNYMKQGRSVRYRMRDLLAYQASILVIPQ